MNINIEQGRTNIDLFNLNCKDRISKTGTYMNTINYKIIILLFMLLLTHGDIESNAGPPKKISSYFLLCHWNANSILAHNKLSLLTTYNITYKYDIICVSEICQNSSVDSNNLSTPSYAIIRADHPNDQKRGWVCLYFKENVIPRN